MEWAAAVSASLRFGPYLEPVGRPGHGDKIKLNCFMTVDNCLDRQATVVGHSRKAPSGPLRVCSLEYEAPRHPTGLKSQLPSSYKRRRAAVDIF